MHRQCVGSLFPKRSNGCCPLPAAKLYSPLRIQPWLLLLVWVICYAQPSKWFEINQEDIIYIYMGLAGHAFAAPIIFYVLWLTCYWHQAFSVCCGNDYLCFELWGLFN